MRRLAIAAALVVSSIPGATSAQEPGASVAVRIAKTDASIIPFGTVEGGSGKVVLRLSKQTETGWRRLSTARVSVEDDGSFRSKFARPERGECRIVARYDGTRDEESFHCYIPDFPLGSAELTSQEQPLTPVRIDALIADNDRRRGYGLMYRPRLRTDLGMAFLWESDTQGGFWMKNTLIPLSIAFFDSNGLILRIVDMEPCEADPCPTYGPGDNVSYRGALEVNRGAFDEWAIAEGDRIEIQR